MLTLSWPRNPLAVPAYWQEEEERMRSRTTPRPPGPRPGRRTLLTGIPLLGAGALALGGCTPDDAGAATDVEEILTISLNQTENAKEVDPEGLLSIRRVTFLQLFQSGLVAF